MIRRYSLPTIDVMPIHRRTFRGFTLIELLVTIAVIGVMAALAAPSFRDFIVRRNLESITSEFQADVMRSRSEAVSRNVCVTMCMSSSAANASPACTSSGTDWQVGWIVFLNPACDSTQNSPTTAADLISARVNKSGDYHLEAQGSTPTKKFMFNSRGSSGLTSAELFKSLYISIDNDLTNKYAKNICVDGLGRARAIPSADDCGSYK